MSGARLRLLAIALLLVAAGASVGLSSAAARPAGAARARSCPHPTVPVPANEPVYRVGPTEVVAGLYVQGGPVPRPPCKPEPRGPYAGKVTVRNAKTGALVASRTVGSGHLAYIKLAPGRYRLSGHISGGARTTTSPTVTIRRGYKTRQDLFEDVP